MIRVARVVASIAILLTVLLTASNTVSANYGQYGPYGPVPEFSISVDKLVAKPNSSTDFVDNFSPSDPRFSARQGVIFRLIVKNPSDQTLTDVTVVDTLPDFLEAVEGSGTFNSDDRTLTIQAGDFASQEERVYAFTARVVGQDKLPSDQGIFCLINHVRVSGNDVADEDTAQFCVEKKVPGGVTQVPAAGPEMGLALIGLNMLGLSAGLYLRKKS